MDNIGNNIVQTGFQISRSATGGYQTVREYEGTRLAIEGFAMTIPKEATYSIDDSERPKCKLAITFPYLDSGNVTPEAPTNTWELPGNAIQKDIYEHPNSLALGRKLITIIKVGVQKVSEADSPATVDVPYNTTISAIEGSGGNPVSIAGAKLLFDLVLKGQNQYQTTQYVLRHTRTIGARTDVILSFANVEKIYTVDQINTEDPIPVTPGFSISNIPAPATISDYTWGWLKQAPSVRQVAANKYEIVNEWWLEQWSNFLYATI